MGQINYHGKIMLKTFLKLQGYIEYMYLLCHAGELPHRSAAQAGSGSCSRSSCTTDTQSARSPGRDSQACHANIEN